MARQLFNDMVRGVVAKVSGESGRLARRAEELADDDDLGRMKLFTAALRIDDRNAAAHLGLARVLNKLGHAKRALVHAERAVELDDTNQEAAGLLGELFIDKVWSDDESSGEDEWWVS